MTLQATHTRSPQRQETVRSSASTRPSVVLDLNRSALSYGDKSVHVRAQVRDLLSVLARAHGGAIAKDALIQHIWGDDEPADGEGHLRRIVFHCQQALAEIGSPDLIKGERGLGYATPFPIEIIERARLLKITPDVAEALAELMSISSNRSAVYIISHALATA